MRTATRATIVLLVLMGASPAAGQEVAHSDPIVCEIWCPIIHRDSGVTVKRYIVETSIEDQVATTRITQVLRNDRSHGVAEGFLYLPIPPGAAVTDLVLWIDGEPVTGELLDAGKARHTYRDIVSTLKDPALLEWVDLEFPPWAGHPDNGR